MLFPINRLFDKMSKRAHTQRKKRKPNKTTTKKAKPAQKEKEETMTVWGEESERKQK